jgi:hypothetical protein
MLSRDVFSSHGLFELADVRGFLGLRIEPQTWGDSLRDLYQLSSCARSRRCNHRDLDLPGQSGICQARQPAC